MKLSTASKILAVVLGSAIAVAFVFTFVSTTSAASYVFTRDLKMGSSGTDVQNLQMVLNADPSTQVAATGAGSPGMESTYFGALTKAAVIKFQNKYASQVLAPVGLTTGTGYVGASTRALLNNWSATTVSNCPAGAMYNPQTGALCTTTPPPVSNCPAGALFNPQTGAPCTGNTTVSGPVSVSLASTPSYGALVSPSATAQLASFTFSGNGTVTNVNLQRIGVSSDTTLTNVYLYDGATRLTDAASVSSGNISFNNPSGLFMVNGSRTVTVRADIASSQGGATVGVSLVSYAVTGGSPATVNISGTTQNIASNITAATVSVGTQTVGSQSINAGASSLVVWSAPLNVGTRSVYLQAVGFKYIGSAPTNAITNTQLLVDGSVVASGSIDSNSFLTFNLSANPLTLNTGSHTLSVQSDVVGGAYRSFQLSLQNSGDLMVADSQLQGVNVAPTTVSLSTFTTNTGGLITINNGTVSVQVDPDFTATTVTGGATNVPIAQFKFTSYGEDVKVNSLSVEPQIGGADRSFNNVGVYVNGGQVGSTAQDATTTLVFGSNNLFTIPAGQSVIVTIKADTISAQNTNYSVGNITVVLPHTGSYNISNAQGVQSSQITDVPSSAITSNPLALGSGSPTVAKNASLANFTTSPNVTNVKIGSYVIQASSAEGLRVNNIVVSLGGSITPSTGLATLKIVTPAGTTNPVAPQTTNSFSTNGFVIPANGSASVDVYADIGGSSGSASSSISVSAQGTISNISVTGSAVGQTATVGTGQLYAPTLVSTSPVAQYVVSGAPSGGSFAAAIYNFVSTTSPATITKLTFSIGTVSTSTASLTVSAPGASSVTATVAGGLATVSGLSIPVPVGFSGTNVTVTPNFVPVGLGGLGTDANTTVVLTGVEANVGTTPITPLSSLTVTAPASGAFHLVASKPTITISNPGTSLVTGSVRLARVTVAADAAGAINVNQIPISVQSNSALAALTSQILVIKDSNGNAITGATSTAIAVPAGGSGVSNVTFTSPGYRVDANSSMSFDIYGTESGALGVAGASSLVTSMATTTSFTWTDVNGASSVGGLTGQYLTNYPTNTSSVSN